MPDALLSITEARAHVLNAVQSLGAEDVALGEAAGRVLAADVVAAVDVPPFANSAMDGFAVAAGPAGRRLRIAAESRAGRPAPVGLSDGEAIRISTGAPMPAGADGVIIVERSSEHEDGTVTLEAETAPGDNVRGAGEDMRAGEMVLTAGELLGPAAIGVAAAAGAATLRCARRPRLAILGTGDELAEPGERLDPGQIYDSNRVALAALARAAGADVVDSARVPDALDATEAAIGAALEAADVVVVSGGVSVGPHDHVKAALAALGVEESFWRVALKPGKPTWFGARGERLVFGLPGNPVSAMVTFVLFVRPALAALQGASPDVARTTAALAEPVRRSPDRDQAVRVRVEDGRAHPTGPQGSHVLTSMLGANGLAIVPMGDGELRAGDMVDVEPL